MIFLSFFSVFFPLNKYFYIYNKEKVKLGFNPEIEKYALCKQDKRYMKPRSYDNLCGEGYREILISPYSSRYS